MKCLCRACKRISTYINQVHSNAFPLSILSYIYTLKKTYKASKLNMKSTKIANDANNKINIAYKTT